MIKQETEKAKALELLQEDHVHGKKVYSIDMQKKVIARILLSNT